MDSEMSMNWVEWLNSNHGLISATATVVIALFAIVTALLTRSLANENRLIRKSGTEPKVVTYLATDSQRPHVINFVLANVGRGPAMNVEFSIEGDKEDFRAHRVSSAFTSHSGGMGTDLLPQGERIQSFFGVGPSLLASPPLRCFTVRLTYENLEGKTHEANYQIDVVQLGWISWLVSDR